MSNELQLIKSERFGTVFCDFWRDSKGDMWFTREQIGQALEYGNPRIAIANIHERNADRLDKLSAVVKLSTPSGAQDTYLYSQKGLNEVCRFSRQSKADAFMDWVWDVVESIRKTGGYVGNEDMFVNTYLPFADDNTKTLFKSTLDVIRQNNELIQKQKKELEYKEDVIIGLVDEVELAEKRQTLNRVVRHNGANFQERWKELYKQFDMKYHINVKQRMETYNSDHKPKMKSYLDYVDVVMGKVPELYEIACKLYCNDIKELTEEMYEITRPA
jgi:prophage antirepressor-like protein